MSKVTVVSRPNRIVISSKGVQGAPGPQGEQGEQGLPGPKGDTGDVTPAALAARDAAQEAASTASTAASTATGAASAASGSASAAAASAEAAETARVGAVGAARSYALRSDLPAASGFSEGYTVWVNNDPTPANNGTWAVLGGTWVQSADRVSGLEGRVSSVEAEIDEVLPRVGALRTGNGAEIETLTDDRGAVVRVTDADGEIHVPGLPEGLSVQAAIREVRGSVGATPRGKDVLVLVDSAANVVVRMDYRGGLYLPGLRQPLQAAVGATLSATRFPRTWREELHPAIKPLVADLVTECQPFVPPPALLVPNNYGVPNSFISDFSVEQDVGIVLETPYAPGGLVHPYLIEMRAPFLGYRFILGETPHKHSNPWQENPIVYGSNDLKTFDLIPDVPQPLGYPPGDNSGYNSDIAWTYDPRSGMLIAVWRSVAGESVDFHFRWTFNGFDWSEELVAPAVTGSLSPAILYDPIRELWHLWTVWPKGVVSHYTGPDFFGPWTFEGSQNLNSTFGINVWHAEVKWLGERFAILANVDGEMSNLWLGLSDDGNAWDMGAPLISPQVPNVYKGTFIPEFDGDRYRIHVAWNTYVYPLPPGAQDNFHLVTSNWSEVSP